MTETIETRWEKFSEAGRECASAKQYDKAEEAYLAAMRAAEHFGDDDPRLPATLNALARVYCMRNKFFPAAALLHRLVAIAERTLGDQHPRVAGVVANLAEMYARLGDIRQELTLRERAHAIRKNSGESDDATLAKGYERLVFLRRKHAESTGQPVQITPAAAITPVSVPTPVAARPAPPAAAPVRMPTPMSVPISPPVAARAAPFASAPVRMPTPMSVPISTPVSSQPAVEPAERIASPQDDRPFEPLFIDLNIPISEQIRQPVAPPFSKPAPEPFVHAQPRAATPQAAEPVYQRLAPEPLVSSQPRAATPKAAEPVPSRLAPSPFINPPPIFEKSTPAEPVRQRLAPEPLQSSESHFDPTPDGDLMVVPQSLWERFKSRRFAMIGGAIAIVAVGLWITMSGGPDGVEAAPPKASAVVVVDPRIEQNRIAEQKRKADAEAVELGMAVVGALKSQTSASAAAQPSVRTPELARTERREEEAQPESVATPKLSIPKPVNIDKIVGGIDASVRANVDSANKTLGYKAPTFKKP